MKRLTAWQVAGGALLALILAPAFSPAVPAAAAAEPANVAMEPAPQDASALFQTSKVWSVELRLTPPAWAAMEPKGGGNVLGVMATMAFGGGGGRGPADLLAAAMLKRGDRNHDGRLDRDECDALAARWFSLWDNTHAESIDLDNLRGGLKATLDPEGVFESKFPVFLRGTDGRRNGLASAAGIDFQYERATLVFEGTPFEDVGLRYKGNGTFIESRATLKRSLKLDLNHFVRGRKLAGLPKLNLHNNVTDASGMIEAVAYGLYRDAGVPAPRTAYAQVYLTVPPKHEQTYLGLYSIVEDVDKEFAKDRFGTRKGALFKPITPNLFADLGDAWSDFKQAYDPKTEVSDAQARRVMDLSKLMSYATDADLAAHVGEFIDLDEFARFMAVTAYLASMDSILQIGQNYYLHLDRQTNRFRFIPWDVDHAFGRIFGDQGELARMSVHTPWASPNRFLERVFRVPAFKDLYLARLREFSETLFSPERLAAQVDEIAGAIRPSVEGESPEKLALFDDAVSEGAPGQTGRRRALKFVKGFSRMRTESVRDQLAGRSEGVRPKTVGPGAGRSGATPEGKPAGPTLAAFMFERLDADHDGRVSRAEFTGGFGRWFSAWSRDREGGLSDEQLRDGIRAEVFPSASVPQAPPQQAGQKVER